MNYQERCFVTEEKLNSKGHLSFRIILKKNFSFSSSVLLPLELTQTAYME